MTKKKIKLQLFLIWHRVVWVNIWAFDKGSLGQVFVPQTVSDSASSTENQIKSLNKVFNRYNFCKTPNDISDDPNNIGMLNVALTTAENVTLHNIIKHKVMF